MCAHLLSQVSRLRKIGPLGSISRTVNGSRRSNSSSCRCIKRGSRMAMRLTFQVCTFVVLVLQFCLPADPVTSGAAEVINVDEASSGEGSGPPPQGLPFVCFSDIYLYASQMRMRQADRKLNRSPMPTGRTIMGSHLRSTIPCVRYVSCHQSFLLRQMIRGILTQFHVPWLATCSDSLLVCAS